jgi:hypothetical protein
MFYEISISLQYIDPPIWRTVLVPPRTNLHKFHKIIQRAMGWRNSHLYIFEVDRERYAEPHPEWDIDILDSRKKTLAEMFTGGRKAFVYDYDMGDGWRHDIELVKAVECEPGAKPRVLDGARACPPEDSGGPPGYMNLLVTLSDPQSEDYRDMMDWLGGPFDPNAFDLQAADEAVRKVR